MGDPSKVTGLLERQIHVTVFYLLHVTGVLLTNTAIVISVQRTKFHFRL